MGSVRLEGTWKALFIDGRNNFDGQNDLVFSQKMLDVVLTDPRMCLEEFLDKAAVALGTFHVLSLSFAFS